MLNVSRQLLTANILRLESKQLKRTIMEQIKKRKFLAALPCFPTAKGFNHRTILVSAKDEFEAMDIIRHLKPNDYIGEIKEVYY